MKMIAWNETTTHRERTPGWPSTGSSHGLRRAPMKLEPRLSGALRVCLSATLPALLIVLLAACSDDPMQPVMVDGGTDSPAGVPLSSSEFEMMVAAVPELSAADFGRGVTLEQIARRWVRHAEWLHGRATALAGPNPQPPVTAWLQAAGQLLGQAAASLAAGNHQAAIAQSQASVHLSYKVIDALEEPPEPLDLQDRARAAIDTAAGLLAQASALAGSAPSDRVTAALRQAEALLHESQVAFRGEDYPAAIRLARQSAGISQAVIRYLNG